MKTKTALHYAYATMAAWVTVFVLALGSATCAHAQSVFQPPDIEIRDWTNSFGVRESLGIWDATNSAPNTIWHYQVGLTNSEPGEPLEADWTYPGNIGFLITQTGHFENGVFVIDPVFIAIIPYSPQWIWRPEPWDDTHNLWPRPTTPGPVSVPNPVTVYETTGAIEADALPSQYAGLREQAKKLIKEHRAKKAKKGKKDR